MLDMHHDFMRVGECKLSCVMSSRGARNLEGHIMQTVMHHATVFRVTYNHASVTPRIHRWQVRTTGMG